MRYFTFQWHITEKCDQRCKHCYIYSVEKEYYFREMDYNEMRFVFTKCMDFCVKIARKPYFVITGGDPILNKDFWKLLRLLNDNSVPFSILGNPYHLTNVACNDLYLMGCRKYQLSLDGLEGTHDYIRMKGSYKTTLEKINVIKNSGIKCVIMATVSKLNINEIPELIDVVVDRNVDVFSFARYCSTNGKKDLLVTPDEYHNLLSKCWEKFVLYKYSGTCFNLKDHLWNLFLYEKGLFKINPALDDNTIYEGCNCAINHLTILENGDLFACRRMDSCVGNVFDDNIYDVFMGDKMDLYRKYDLFEKCSRCELLRFCRGCPATAYSINGNNLYAPDPQCWKK